MRVLCVSLEAAASLAGAVGQTAPLRAVPLVGTAMADRMSSKFSQRAYAEAKSRLRAKHRQRAPPAPAAGESAPASPPTVPCPYPSDGELEDAEEQLVHAIRCAGLRPGRENHVVDLVRSLRDRRRAFGSEGKRAYGLLARRCEQALRERASLKEEMATSLARAAEDKKAAVVELSAATTAWAKERDEKHRAELVELAAQYRARLDEALRDADKAHAAELRGVKDAHARQLHRSARRLREESKKTAEAAAADIHREVASLRAEHRESRDLLAQSETRRLRQERELQDALADAERLRAEVSDLKRASQADADALRSAMEAERDKWRERLRAEEDRTAAARERAGRAVEDLREACEAHEAQVRMIDGRVRKALAAATARAGRAEHRARRFEGEAAEARRLLQELNASLVAEE